MQVHLVLFSWLATVCLMSCYTASAKPFYDTDTEQLLQSLEAALGDLQEPVDEDMLVYDAGAYSKRASPGDSRRFSVCYDPIKLRWRRCRPGMASKTRQSRDTQ